MDVRPVAARPGGGAGRWARRPRLPPEGAGYPPGMEQRQQVVIVGGGFGGVRAAQKLRDAPVDITLIDRTNHHLFQPLLYQVATGVLSPGQIAPALRTLFRRQDNVRVLLGRVEDVDVGRRVVLARAEDPLELPYDTLILAAGATHSYFGHDEWAEVAPGMKNLDDANRIRSRILGAFELAEQETDPAERDAWLTFAVVGGGPTGVELAGQVALLANRVLRGEYRCIDSRQARVLLLDAAPTLLGPFPQKLRDRARRDLAGLGVEVELEAPVVSIDRDGLDVDGPEGPRRIPARTVIWAAGVKASPLAGRIAGRTGARTDRAGRLLVEPDLTVPGHPEIFAIGDMVGLEGVPGTAQPAIQEGAYVSRVVLARLRGARTPKPFSYDDKGMMATIGRAQAVAQIGRLQFGGFPAFLIWGIVHLAYLVGWGNRFEAVVRWMWTLLARNRRERLISIVSLVSEDRAREELDRMRSDRRAPPVRDQAAEPPVSPEPEMTRPAS